MVKNLLANAEDKSSIPGLGRSLEEGNGNLLQYSCPGNPTDRGAWWAIVHEGVTKESDTTKGLNNKRIRGLFLGSHIINKIAVLYKASILHTIN